MQRIYIYIFKNCSAVKSLTQKRLWLSLYIFILLAFPYPFLHRLSAQSLDSTTLGTVVISEPHRDKFKYEIDSLASMGMLGNTLDQGLSHLAPFYIKNYGAGNISTGTYRGGNASQIAINWNGLNIQNVSSGNTDFSLIPSNVTDQLSFSPTEKSNSSFGEINLTNKHQFHKLNHLQVSSQYALQQVLSNQFVLGLGNGKHSFKISYSQRKGNNTYPYFDGMEIQKQGHSALYQKNIYTDYAYKNRKHWVFALTYWGQNFDRQVPPPLHNLSWASQNDRFNRLMFKVEKEGVYHKFHYQQALLDESLTYTDPSKSLYSNIASKNWINNLSFHKKWSQGIQAQSQINNSYQFSNSQNYSKAEHRNLFFVNQSIVTKLNASQTQLEAFAKLEWVNTKLNPFQYGIIVHQNVYKQLMLTAKAQRYLRNPTFNDLYWKDWGNTSLKPEQGLVYDLDLIYEGKFLNINHRMQVGTYSKMINNWIIWLPVNASLWNAQNARKVWARGLEITENLKFKVSKVRIQITGYYSYVKSTYVENNLNSSENIIHKQLIYVPPHQASISATIIYKRLALRYSHQYTSWRFTSSDNEDFLSSYNIASCYINIKPFRNHNSSWAIDCGIDNLYNQNIQSVANIPMPLRTYKIGIIYQLN